MTNDFCSTFSRESFLNFDPNTELSFEDKSSIYCSLVALVKEKFPFDDALLDKAVRFLKSLEPNDYNQSLGTKLVTDLVPSSAGSLSGFIESILTLSSSSHSTVVTAALSFLYQSTCSLPKQFQFRLVESNIMTNLFATIQPHRLPISGNEEIFVTLIHLIKFCLDIASLYSVWFLGINDAVDQFNHREMIFRNVVIPSSQFVTFLISNRNILNGNLYRPFLILLSTLLYVGPFHRPTLEFILASPIVMGFSSCITIIGCDWAYSVVFDNLDTSFEYRPIECPEMAQSSKLMIQALFSEGFEDILEQMMKYDKNGDLGYTGIECEGAAIDCIANDVLKLPLSNDSNSCMRALIECWECTDCWCRRTDSVMASNRPEIVCSFGFIVLNGAIFNCHIVNRPLSKEFLASLNDTL